MGKEGRATHIQLADRLTAGNLDWREEKEAMEKVVPSRDFAFGAQYVDLTRWFQ